jgi:hypothetical protein
MKIAELAALLQSIAWPVITVTLAILFRRPLIELARSLRHRIDAGSAIQTPWLSIGPAPALIDVPGATEQITEDHVALRHSSWRYPKKDAEFRRSMYAFHVIVEAADDVLDRIERVTYTLHPSYKDRVHVISDRASRFKLKELAWGESIVRAEVRVRDQEQPIQLRRYIDLWHSGPRI